MAHRVLAETAVSISEHKKNPMATLAAGEGMAVAVLNRNEPAFYCVPAKAYEELMDLVDDLELGRIAGSPSGVEDADARNPGAVQEQVGRAAD
jgi:antitoxin StbD